MKNTVVTNSCVVTNVNLGMDFYILSNFHILSDVAKGSQVELITIAGILTNENGLFNSLFQETGDFFIFFQQGSKTQIGVVYPDEGSADIFSRSKIL